MAFDTQVRVGLANIGITFAASQACFVVSGGTELTVLPFLPLCLLRKSGQGSDWGLHTPNQTGRGWCAGKVLVAFNKRSHQSFPQLC